MMLRLAKPIMRTANPVDGRNGFYAKLNPEINLRVFCFEER
jgi:hypothetical protein